MSKRLPTVAWETDLADAIKSIDANRARGLVAMMPAWASPTGQWSFRQITEVWLDSGEDGTFVTLTDIADERFGAGIRGEPPRAGPAGELLLRLPSGKHRTPRPRLPGYFLWAWDGDFCGSFSLRWQNGTSALPD